jgi:hypothetical protein
MQNELPETPDLHGFVIMGKENLFLCHLPMFYAINHRYQLIFKAELGSDDKSKYLKVRNENPGKVLILGNHSPMILKDIVNSESFMAEGYVGMPNLNSKPFLTPKVLVKDAILFEHLNPDSGNEYPKHLTYYLYGANSDYHISHLISKYPNFQQEVDVTLSQDFQDMIINTKTGITKIIIPSLHEKDNQPIKIDPLKDSDYVISMNNSETAFIKIGTYSWFDVDMLNVK